MYMRRYSLKHPPGYFIWKMKFKYKFFSKFSTFESQKYFNEITKINIQYICLT